MAWSYTDRVSPARQAMLLAAPDFLEFSDDLGQGHIVDSQLGAPRQPVPALGLHVPPFNHRCREVHHFIDFRPAHLRDHGLIKPA